MKLRSVSNAVLTSGGDRAVSGAGLFVLGGFADRVGLSGALAPRGERAPTHDRGVLLTHLCLALAGGGEACSDIEHLRAQPELFGPVASDSTLWRALSGVGDEELDGLWQAAGAVRERVWPQTPATGPLVVDIDSTLVEVHSENKQGAAPHYKGGYGFHPMVCSTDEGEPLWGMLRPGNAAANSIDDHLSVLDNAIGVLPASDAAGHRLGDPKDSVRRRLLVRIDAAGCSARIALGCRKRNVGFAVTARAADGIDTAIAAARFDDSVWAQAIPNPKHARKPNRTQVAELTALVDLSGWPEETRLIVRREPLHPGARRSLFASENWRYWGFLTDAPGSPAHVDTLMRHHAHVENSIERLKDSGLARMPFAAWHANRAWTAMCLISLAPLTWFQTHQLTGALAKAAPKRLRWQLWHLPGIVCRRARRTLIRIPTRLPGARALLAAQHPR